MAKSSIKFKEIQLYPTDFFLDVWVGRARDIMPHFKTRYGFKDDPEVGGDQVVNIQAGSDSPLKCEKRVVLKLRSLNRVVIVHEIIHILYRINQYTNIELNESSQEWQAYFSDYLFTEITRNNYSHL